MASFICIIPLLFVQLISVHSAPTPNRLLFVQTLWRHGDRSPTETFPSDPNTEEKWPQGFGQLTTRGMTQQFKLGDLIRKTYIVNGTKHNYHLDAAYNRTQMHIRSTDVDRTLMSAYSNLAGMYPNGSHITHPSQKGVAWPGRWSPIPVHTINLLNPGVTCPVADAAIAKFYDSDPDVQGNATMYAEFLRWVEGPDAANITEDKRPLRLKDLWLIWDAIFIEMHYNETTTIVVPEWTKKSFVVNGTSYKVTTLLATLDYRGSYWYQRTQEVARLRGGPLLSRMIDNMKQFIACRPYLPRDIPFFEASAECQDDRFVKGLVYQAFSAHDTTVLALLRSLHDAEKVIHLSEGGLPHYAAAVAVELWQDDEEKYYVKINYHDGRGYMEANYTHTETWRNVTRLTSGCPSNSDFCPLDTFVERSKPYFIKDAAAWDYECGNISFFTSTKLTGILVGVVTLCVCLMAMVTVLCEHARRNRRRRGGTIVQGEEEGEGSDASDTQALMS